MRFTEEQAKVIREQILSDDSTIPLICLPPQFTKEDIIYAIRHPNKKRPRPQYVIEMRSELTPEEKEVLKQLMDRHKEALGLLAGEVKE